jgi:hypothetical protein
MKKMFKTTLCFFAVFVFMSFFAFAQDCSVNTPTCDGICRQYASYNGGVCLDLSFDCANTPLYFPTDMACVDENGTNVTDCQCCCINDGRVECDEILLENCNNQSFCSEVCANYADRKANYTGNGICVEDMFICASGWEQATQGGDDTFCIANINGTNFETDCQCCCELSGPTTSTSTTTTTNPCDQECEGYGITPCGCHYKCPGSISTADYCFPIKEGSPYCYDSYDDKCCCKCKIKRDQNGNSLCEELAKATGASLGITLQGICRPHIASLDLYGCLEGEYFLHDNSNGLYCDSGTPGLSECVCCGRRAVPEFQNNGNLYIVIAAIGVALLFIALRKKNPSL